jgi:hypothetical protein
MGARTPRLAFETGTQVRVVATFFVVISVEIKLDVIVLGFINFVLVSPEVIVIVEVIFDFSGL